MKGSHFFMFKVRNATDESVACLKRGQYSYESVEYFGSDGITEAINDFAGTCVHVNYSGNGLEGHCTEKKKNSVSRPTEDGNHPTQKTNC
jgi:hypothetical protein